MAEPLVGIVMGSTSDWPTMQNCTAVLEEFGVDHEVKVLSAHRTPKEAADWAAGAPDRGIKVIIAAAGGAAHLAGAMAAQTVLPVLGVPMTGWALDGLDSLLSTVQMPRGIPVATLAIGKAGAVNAALLAIQILATADPALTAKLRDHRQAAADAILNAELD
ncbi:MAG: 5-(carboxyamino)imidazole ribonucleotide mutase [Chloroflexota bacterium]|jgi:5-(carboxyamino)imidazole ribonucleotide mutase|nr:5-(carboxyamino)imidazole ribonucleotide mutase [Chloroflexota bacterium]MDP6508792.1 5-(carboxyamino)imidazole ribonucleotide mutase [Chloroflexota bacterium]MDP6758011.1 5-(carboxyamino)imidazole ribonucleotide mutase [Chloroflexota bacterium]